MNCCCEHFTIAWKKWAVSKGEMVRNQSHGSPANTLDLYSAVDIPETEGNDILRFKFATSAANVTGKPLVSSESATWLNEHFLSSLGDVKKAIDLYFLGGVNHIFYHGISLFTEGMLHGRVGFFMRQYIFSLQIRSGKISIC